MRQHQRSRKCAAHAKSAKGKLLAINVSDFVVDDLAFEEVHEGWRGACGVRGNLRRQYYYKTGVLPEHHRRQFLQTF
jgi:hypothetical protein